jgi:hypothetical protein
MTNKIRYNVLRLSHRVCAIGGFIIVCAFFCSTFYAELFGGAKTLYTVKRNIVFLLPLLIFCMAGAVASGRKAGNVNNEIVRRKMKRMRFVGVNGVLLIIIAIVLYRKADNGSFDSTFWVLQGIEQILGISNIILMVFMIVDGMRLSGRLSK